MRRRSPEIRVHPPSVTVLARTDDPAAVWITCHLHHARRLRRIDARTLHPRRQQTGRLQDRVANHFRLQSHAVLPAEQSVAWVFLIELRARSGRLTIRRRHHDHAVQPFHAPLVLTQLVGQPVKQLWMRGQGALRAEVVFRLDQPHAKEPLPGAIDDDTRRQRLFAGDQPPC